MRFELFSFAIHPKKYYDFSICSIISNNGEKRYSLVAVWWTFMDGLEFEILFTYWGTKWLILELSVEDEG